MQIITKKATYFASIGIYTGVLAIGATGAWAPPRRKENMSKGTLLGNRANKIFFIFLDLTANIFSWKQINSESSILLAEKNLKADNNNNKHCV